MKAFYTQQAIQSDAQESANNRVDNVLGRLRAANRVMRAELLAKRFN